jgi:hypothetical protein
MDSAEKINFIRQKACEHLPEANEKILWSVHAIRKLRLERLRKVKVEESLKQCEMVEDYAMEGRPLPGCLVICFIGGMPFHSVVALDYDLDRIFIITVYKPSSERWESDWKSRKRQS